MENIICQNCGGRSSVTRERRVHCLYCGSEYLLNQQNQAILLDDTVVAELRHTRLMAKLEDCKSELARTTDRIARLEQDYEVMEQDAEEEAELNVGLNRRQILALGGAIFLFFW